MCHPTIQKGEKKIIFRSQGQRADTGEYIIERILLTGTLVNSPFCFSASSCAENSPVYNYYAGEYGEINFNQSQ